jgi:hypothetical protein
MKQLRLLQIQYFKLYPNSKDGETVAETLKFLAPYEQLKNTALSTLQLFNTDTKITTSRVVIARDEFIAKAISGTPIDVYYPHKSIPFILTNDSNLLSLLQELANYQTLTDMEIGVEQTKVITRIPSDSTDDSKSKVDDDSSDPDEISTDPDDDSVDPDEDSIDSGDGTRNADQSVAVGANTAGAQLKRKLDLERLRKQYTSILHQLNLVTETELPPPADLVSGEEYSGRYANVQRFFDRQEEKWKFNLDRWRADRNNVRKRNTIDFLRAETAYNLLTSDNDGNDPKKNYWLEVKIALSGGNTKVDKNLMLDIFRGGNKVSFSAAAVVSYSVYRSDGKMLVSDTILTYMPYQKTGNISEFVCTPTNTRIKDLIP